MRTKVQKWGNSLALRIPKAFAQDAQLGDDSLVDITYVDGQIIVSPVGPSKWSLADLLAGINQDNIHREVDSGPAIGNEIW